MQIETLCQSRPLSVLNFRCTASPNDRPFSEEFSSHSISYVRKGSFGCESRGRHFELVPGSLLIGHTGDEYLCTHDHHCGGDECLSFQLAPEFVEQSGADEKVWRLVGIPPLVELMILGEMACSVADGRSDVAMEEVGLLLVHRFVEAVAARSLGNTNVDARQRRRAIEVAMWIDENSHSDLSLDVIASTAGVSPFHFLRVFTRVLGVTPHQYLVRSRLRRAIHMLTEDNRTITKVALDSGFNDLSNFVRTFHRAAGMPPSHFRRLARGERKIFQD